MKNTVIRRLLERSILGPRPSVPLMADPRSTIRWIAVASSEMRDYIGHSVAIGRYAKALSAVEPAPDLGGVLVVLRGADGLVERHVFAPGVELPVCVDIDDAGRRR